MLESPGPGSASRVNDFGAGSDRETSGPDPDAGVPRRMPRWGQYPAWAGVVMLLAAAVLGTVFTVVSDRDPGMPLGLFVVGGTVAAGTSTRARSAYAIIPVPALAYAAGAVIAGLVYDRAVDTSRTALTLSAAQWIATGFIAMTAATILAALLALARYLVSTREARVSRRARQTSTSPPGKSA